MSKKVLSITIILLVLLVSIMQLWAAEASGFIGKYVNGKEVGLSGATVIVGKNIDLKIGETGTDKVTGTIAGKTVTDSDGSFTLDVPSGNYTVIVWKAGYTPQIDTDVPIDGYTTDLMYDNQGQGLHQYLSL